MQRIVTQLRSRVGYLANLGAWAPVRPAWLAGLMTATFLTVAASASNAAFGVSLSLWPVSLLKIYLPATVSILIWEHFRFFSRRKP